MKDRWDKAQSLATIASLLAVPMVLAWGGWLVQERLAEQATKREYVEAALEILRTPTAEDSADSRALRVWAVDVVDQFAPVKLSEAARDELMRQQLGLDPFEWWRASRGSDCVATYIITGNEKEFEACAKKARERVEDEQGESDPPKWPLTPRK
jgi:hypothetical protein